jgi:hypothetical protein
MVRFLESQCHDFFGKHLKCRFFSDFFGESISQTVTFVPVGVFLKKAARQKLGARADLNSRRQLCIARHDFSHRF